MTFSVNTNNGAAIALQYLSATQGQLNQTQSAITEASTATATSLPSCAGARERLPASSSVGTAGTGIVRSVESVALDVLRSLPICLNKTLRKTIVTASCCKAWVRRRMSICDASWESARVHVMVSR